MLNQEELIKIALSFVLAIFGGFCSYLVSAEQFSLRWCLIKSISSGFVGLLTGLLCIYFALPDSLTYFICGTFGYMGSEVSIALFKKFVQKKLNQLN